MIENYRNEFIELYKKMLSIKAVNPSGGGNGEYERANFLKNVILSWSKDLKFEEYIAESNGLKRPNLLFLLDSGKRNNIWFVGHMDTVSEGDLSLWKYPPFEGTVVGDQIYGRGSCDNGQGIMSSLLALRYFIDHPKEMENNIGVILVSDEEAGSKFGIQFVLSKRKFGENDFFVVPDFGTPDGSEIEVAEKGIMWIKFNVEGIQCHGSTPNKGKNAHRLARELERRIDVTLHKKFNDIDKLFTVPYSTFEPTKVEPGTSSINIIPGKEAFYFDMRIIPRYKVSEVYEEIKRVCDEFSREFDAPTKIEIVQMEDPSFNGPQGKKFVETLKIIIKEKRGIEPKEIGIGGGTCGAFFRKAGYPTIVWGTLDEVEHMPNEYAKITNMEKDAEVFIELVKKFDH
jgi:acetylornithine deacetylase or succinyl-diaminopimelate desuccinylase